MVFQSVYNHFAFSRQRTKTADGNFLVKFKGGMQCVSAAQAKY